MLESRRLIWPRLPSIGNSSASPGKRVITDGEVRVGTSGSPLWIRENVRYRVVLACAASLLLGGFLIWIAPSDNLGKLLEGIGIALITTGLVALIYEVYLRRSVTAEAFSIAGLSRELADTGIVEVSQFNRIPWADFFEQHGGQIEIFVTYAHSWAHERAGLALSIAAKKGESVTVILLDPDAPDALLSTYASVFEKTPAELKTKIAEAMKEWEVQGKKHGVTVSFELIRTVLPFTYYRVGDDMWLVFAVLRESLTGEVPAIYCRRRRPERGLFNWVIQDVEMARKQGRIAKKGATT
jgi:hypothetical protein